MKRFLRAIGGWWKSIHTMAKEHLNKQLQLGFEKEYTQEMLEKVESLLAQENDEKKK